MTRLPRAILRLAVSLVLDVAFGRREEFERRT
jgi:hypothetical protein